MWGIQWQMQVSRAGMSNHMSHKSSGAETGTLKINPANKAMATDVLATTGGRTSMQ